MKTLYLDLSTGAAGDMISAALLELFPDREAMLARLNAMGVPGVEFRAEAVRKHDVLGTHLHVIFDGLEEGLTRSIILTVIWETFPTSWNNSICRSP